MNMGVVGEPDSGLWCTLTPEIGITEYGRIPYARMSDVSLFWTCPRVVGKSPVGRGYTSPALMLVLPDLAHDQDVGFKAMLLLRGGGCDERPITRFCIPSVLATAKHVI